MTSAKLNSFTKGWFMGQFSPSLLKTDAFEIAVKRYVQGDKEQRHVHRVSTEYTLVVDGMIEMKGIRFFKDDIVIVPPNESTDFCAITDCTTVVIKTPSVKDDKYVL